MLRISQVGLSATVEGLDDFGVEVREAAFYAVVEALQRAYRASIVLISENDHTLKDLEIMEHPYGFKHPRLIHEPDEIIHEQSGEYLHALRAFTPTGVGGTIWAGHIGFDASMQKRNRDLQEGTKRMRARPWMTYLMNTQGQLYAALVEARIDAAIKSQRRKFA